MRRIFREHEVRRVESLDGLWALDTPRGRFQAWVPGVWERIPALADYRGQATYSRTVNLDSDGNALLLFGGVSHTARVTWDGVEVARHYNAFTGFEALIEGAAAGAHELRVWVDDAYGEESKLHIPNDYMTYGGVNRPVELHRVGEAFLERMAFHSEADSEGRFTARVSAFVRAVRSLRGAEVEVRLAGGAARAAVPELSAGQTAAVELAFPVENVERWDVGAGRLYELTAKLIVGGATADDLIDRVGFRTVRVDGERILLNGRPVQIKGFNRHEDHAQFGCALSVDAMMDDLQLAMDAGANALRTCHYPNDPRFLDLCDALGLLVWEEHHVRALPHEILASPLFALQARACNAEMIEQHVNHPCVYVWGVLNECESETPFGRELYRRHLEHLRQLDPTRPVTYASCRFFTDVCLDLPDIVSFNIYPGWYVNEPTADYLKRLVAWMDGAGAKGKPILISEVGAGGIAGFHDPFGKAKWSEERQAEVVAEQLDAILNDPRLSGVYVWQFADVRVSEEWAMRRPKSMNNKGVVDGHRQPKLAYFAVKRAFK